MKYRETQPGNFQKQIYIRLHEQENLGVNDLSR